MSVSDLTGTKWVINSSISSGTFLVEDLTFTSNSTTYTGMWNRLGSPQARLDYIIDENNATNVYSSSTWQNEAYRTIEITGGTDVTNSTLISWLESNAIYQEPTPSSGNIVLGSSEFTPYLGSSMVSAIYFGSVKIYEYVEPTVTIQPPTISLYDDNSALKIESANDYEDEYEIYVDGVLIGTYKKFYDFESGTANTITNCLGNEYYTGELIVPSSIGGNNMTTLASGLLNDSVASKITISEGITTAPNDLFNSNTTTTNVILPSTITNFDCLTNYPQSPINIGLQGYVEYGWTNTLPTPTNNKLFSMGTSTKVVNFYIKSTITTLSDYSLYIAGATSSSSSTSITRNFYFEQSSSETMTIGSNLLYVGVSKFTVKYNIYTDNASIKDAMLTYAGSYCTITVYKRDGSAWE